MDRLDPSVKHPVQEGQGGTEIVRSDIPARTLLRSGDEGVYQYTAHLPAVGSLDELPVGEGRHRYLLDPRVRHFRMPRPLVQSDFRKCAGDLVRGPDVAGRPGREAVDDGRERRRFLTALTCFSR